MVLLNSLRRVCLLIKLIFHLTLVKEPLSLAGTIAHLLRNTLVSVYRCLFPSLSVVHLIKLNQIKKIYLEGRMDKHNNSIYYEINVF